MSNLEDVDWEVCTEFINKDVINNQDESGFSEVVVKKEGEKWLLWAEEWMKDEKMQ